MNFVVGLPRTQRLYDSIWVIIYRLTKLSHFILVKATYSVEEHAKLYRKEILRIHEVRLSIISDRGTQLAYHFLKAFQSGLSNKVKLSTAIYPKRMVWRNKPFKP